MVVSAVVPRSNNQKTYENVEGVKVLSYPLWGTPFLGKLFRKINADVYHSQDPSWGTVIAMNSVPNSKHVVTFQNPKSWKDWSKLTEYYKPRRLLYNYLIEPKVRYEVKNGDRFFCQAEFIIEKARRIYHLDRDPLFLPNPVNIPDYLPVKSDEPLVLFLGRLDGEKNPERFVKLARCFPDIEFVLAGEAHSPSRRRELFKMELPENLKKIGFIKGLEKSRMLEKSWVLVNTSVSECLPVSFLECCAYGCAILSNHNPDGFSSRFGYHVKDGDFERGLENLLYDDKWMTQGNKGREHVSKVNEKARVIDLHLKHYLELLGF